jgi:hypothetical protein
MEVKQIIDCRKQFEGLIFMILTEYVYLLQFFWSAVSYLNACGCIYIIPFVKRRVNEIVCDISLERTTIFFAIQLYHHQLPMNVSTAGAQAFLMDYT